MSEIDFDSLNASELFMRGWRLQQELEKSANEMSDSYALNRKRAIEYLTRSQSMLDELHMFSKNESIDEISTNELKYMINDALLGWLYAKVNSSKPDIRCVALESAKINIMKFLRLTKNYELHSYEVDASANETPLSAASAAEQISEQNKQAVFDANLIKSAHERSEKIRRFKEQKELESKLNAIRDYLTGDDESIRVDDEEKRKLFVMLVKYWLNRSVDDLKMLNDELNILRPLLSGDRAHANEEEATKPKPPPAEAKKPFIITKDALQAQVFGAGYPSVPVYSIEEFYDQLADKGMMPKHDVKEENYGSYLYS